MAVKVMEVLDSLRKKFYAQLAASTSQYLYRDTIKNCYESAEREILMNLLKRKRGN